MRKKWNTHSSSRSRWLSSLSLLFLGALNFSLNNLTLMALTLAIGFLVDDAIVFLENTVRLMEAGQKPLEAAISSAKQITFTIIAMTVSLAVVFLHHRWISAVTWVGCLLLTVWVFGLLPKTFIPAGDSSFIRGIILGPEGISPARFREIQAQVDQVLRENPAVDETFTLSGFSKGLSSNQMLALAFLKDPGQRAPINVVVGQLIQQLGQIPGIIPLVRPDPVLQISTGATKNNQGQFAFSLSGVDSTQVYAVANQMIAKCLQFAGFQSVSSDYFARDRKST